ncbi:MAG: Smr/MutS family protein, partial [Flavobacteriales bacterium]|nr:Smr/MutS family protein [Flavobacteriales bacterium]
YFSGKLEEAIRKKRKNLIVIHGVGKGTLRAEVRKLLDDYPQITYCDASYATYGYGATEVIIE